MLVPALVAPVSVSYTLGLPALLLIPIAALAVGVELGLGVEPGNPTLPEYICSCEALAGRPPVYGHLPTARFATLPAGLESSRVCEKKTVPTHQVHFPPALASGIAGILVLAALVLMAWTSLFRKVEVYFATLPWLAHQRALQARPGGRAYATRCPWTGAQHAQWQV